MGNYFLNNIIHKMIKSICVESEWGKESKFIVTLPSRKITHEDMLGNSKIVNKDKNIQVEFSDITS